MLTVSALAEPAPARTLDKPRSLYCWNMWSLV